ncbi:DUF6379 domain-containing protein [Leifsonia sp. NPDC058194]|uniref:C-glycoside deglycosidase beta subunit domain-containing protein n=1 Tax=Leifsonia sp. NPDC058194 TaxID=3346374 RepID=UPI0036DD1F54
MFDKYILVDDTLRNVETDGSVTGYAVDTRIAYYRGLGLSMVDVALTVDGVAVPTEEITFTVHGNSYRADQMGEIFDDRWGFTEPATLSVAVAGGLAPGEHTVTFTEWLRVSYSGTHPTTLTKTYSVA